MEKLKKEKPLIISWQGIISVPAKVNSSLEIISGFILSLLFFFLPFITRIGLSLLVFSIVLMWLIWSLVTPTYVIRGVDKCMLVFWSVVLISTAFSPVPFASIQGFLKLSGYLSIYALTRKLLQVKSLWWDRLVASLLAGQLLASVIALRQLYMPFYGSNGWSDPSFLPYDLIRIYGSLGNPNLLAGYLVPTLPLALSVILRWQNLSWKLFAFSSLFLGTVSITLTYSRSAWMGLLSALITFLILFSCYQISESAIRQKKFIIYLGLLAFTAFLLILTLYLEPVRIRILSYLAGRADSSSNFRINVWITTIQMIKTRPLLGYGPGNQVFSSIYPFFQKTGFDALGAYSVPLQIIAEIGLLGLSSLLFLFAKIIREGLSKMSENSFSSISIIAAFASIAGLIAMGLTDTIFFRPEVQIVGTLCLSTLIANWESAESKIG